MRRLMLVALASMFIVPAVGCRAEDTVKQGIEGEFCNDRDDDCRDGHICQDGICRATDGGGAISCGDMCARLDECQTGEENCEANCRATIQGTCTGTPCPWSTEAIDAFGLCITEELTCEEARAVDAPQECYRRIPIDADRENRCDAFIAAADRCSPGVSTSELRNQCYLLGRTNTADSWARTDACVERIAGGFCGEIGDCFNSVFELDPALELGVGTLNGTEPLNGQSNNFDGQNVDG